jgi:hypothetical protein
MRDEGLPLECSLSRAGVAKRDAGDGRVDGQPLAGINATLAEQCGRFVGKLYHALKF